MKTDRERPRLVPLIGLLATLWPGLAAADPGLQIEQPNRVAPVTRPVRASDLVRGGHGAPRPDQAAATPAPVTRGVAPVAVLNGQVPPATPDLELVSSNAIEDPVSLSRDQIFAARASERTFYRLAGESRVLVLDMPDIVDQARVFARIVIFLERANAPRTRVLTVPEVKSWQAANKEALATLTIGNNIRGDDFALFFNTLRFQGESVTEDERWLLDRLLAYGVLRERDGGYESGAPEQIVISAPQPSRPVECGQCAVSQGQREIILLHELAHARYITDQVYRNYVWWFWHNGLTAGQRADIGKYLQSLGYDLSVPDMLINEMQAFILHTPESEFFSSKAAGFGSPQLAQLRATFWYRLAGILPLQSIPGYRLP